MLFWNGGYSPPPAFFKGFLGVHFGTGSLSDKTRLSFSFLWQHRQSGLPVEFLLLALVEYLQMLVDSRQVHVASIMKRVLRRANPQGLTLPSWKKRSELVTAKSEPKYSTASNPPTNAGHTPGQAITSIPQHPTCFFK